MIHRFDNVDVSARRCVVFDFDGTLADTKAGICRTAREALLDFGMAEEDLGDLCRLVGPPFPDAFCLVYGLSREDALWVTKRYRQTYAHLGPAAWPAFEGVAGMLERLKGDGRILVVASSKKRSLVEAGVADNRLGEFFDLVCARRSDDDVSKGALMGQTLHELGVSPAEAVMVGDRRNDVEAADANGLPCVGVLYGHTGTLEELRGAGCVAVVDTVAELEEQLRG